MEQNISNLEQQSIFSGDCHINIHWYRGVYSDGRWIYNECAFCKKRQTV